MKKLIFILVAAFGIARGTAQSIYYVSTTGSDSNPGTITQPFRNLQKLSAVGLKAGDIAYIRAGTYKSGVSTGSRGWSLTGLNGTSTNPILITAYSPDFANGGRVIFDCGDFAHTQNFYGIWLENSQFVTISGIRCTNVPQQPITTNGVATGNVTGAWWIINSSNCLIDNCEGDNSMAGFRLDDGANVTFNNCDAHNIDDPYTGPPTGKHGNSDGFGRWANNATGTIYRGCRAWWCSDDGYDMIDTKGTVTFDHCWSFWNGMKPGVYPPVHVSGSETYGDGNGFKMGGTQSTGGLTRFANNCIAASNWWNGFDQNAGFFTARFYNNTGYNCGNNDWKYGYNPPIPHVFKNNLTYKCKLVDGTSSDAAAWGANDHNSWNGISVTDADFVSLDDQQLANPRKPGGALPDITFLQLTPTSKLVNAGVDVGLPYTGTSPDIGAFELGAAQTFKNAEQAKNFQKNDCPPSNTGSAVTYTVPAGKYTSNVSQADADAKATADINQNGQNYANSTGTCTPVSAAFYSSQMQKSIRKNDCTLGVGSVVVYNVPKAKYTSDVSQAAADLKAKQEIDTNGQTYANSNGYCELSPTVTTQLKGIMHKAKTVLHK